jgi:uncharacterized coiled-coil DUF342 family protein
VHNLIKSNSIPSASTSTDSSKPRPRIQPIEVALERVSDAVSQWANDAREHHSKMNKLLENRNDILEEANVIQKERLQIERLRLELLKKQSQG